MTLMPATGIQEFAVLVILIIIVALIIIFCPRLLLKTTPEKVSRMRVSAEGSDGPVTLELTSEDDFDVIYYLVENAQNVTGVRRGRGEPQGDKWISLEVYDNYDDKIRQIWFNDGGIAYEWNIKYKKTSVYKLAGKKSRFDVDYYRELLGIKEGD
ncbi:MAG: hypothetical protein IJP23_03595 [Oscillospiraceae bacterium]|nr:hypothetical protein [Oscillospiraceae bacterium]